MRLHVLQESSVINIATRHIIPGYPQRDETSETTKRIY